MQVNLGKPQPTGGGKDNTLVFGIFGYKIQQNGLLFEAKNQQNGTLLEKCRF